MDNELLDVMIDTQEPIDVFDIRDPDYKAQLAYLVKVALGTIHTRQTLYVYKAHYRRYLATGLPLSRAGVLQYLARDMTQAMRQQACFALRKLAKEAAGCHFLSQVALAEILSIQVKHTLRTRLGSWLTLAGAKQLMALPTRTTLAGKRDAALLAVLLGCGLRRAEASVLTWDKYQMLGDAPGRMILRDIEGKGARVRTVPVPEWARVEIDAWREALGSSEGRLLRSFDGGGTLKGPLSPTGIMNRIQHYSKLLGKPLSPHDLRRTLAQLMRRSGVPVEQIQYTLGHAHIATTERYLGGAIQLEPGEAGVDKVEW